MKLKSKEFNLALVWFGAGVSIAEILTGTYFAPLGLAKGVAAILLGHLIGCALLFFAGYIGARSKRSSMECAKFSFGIVGSKFFALLNVLQLAGWTAIMIYDGAISANEIFKNGSGMWAFIIGAMIILWIALGIKSVNKLNAVAMSALFVLTVILCKIVFFGKGNAQFDFDISKENALSFGAAVELSVAMPLSWIPLAGDYIRESEKPFASSLTCAVTYGVTSCWMYVIGMGVALYAGESDIAKIMHASGLGFAALAIVVLSTVTTTFLDAYSAGISFETIYPKPKGKWISMAVTVLGTLCAIFFPMDSITEFLYLIGSVFVPMIAILCADFFILKTDNSALRFDAARFAIWIFGFALYRISLGWNFILGNTVPVLVVIFLVTLAFGKFCAKK